MGTEHSGAPDLNPNIVGVQGLPAAQIDPGVWLSHPDLTHERQPAQCTRLRAGSNQVCIEKREERSREFVRPVVNEALFR